MKTFLPSNIRCAAVVSPAGLPNKDELEKGISLLKNCGITVKVMPHAFGSETPCPSYLAAADEERAADFMQAYCDDDVDIIFSSRGGYGCGRILPLIDWELLKSKRPKIVAGYSDLTALFFAMTAKNCGIPLASIMAAKLADCQERDLQSIFDACSEKKRTFSLDVIKAGSAKGTILAGNLTVAVSCAGSQYMPDTKGKILIIEDVAEDLYKVDRMFNQLKLNGMLENCSGLVAGYFTDCKKEDINSLLADYSRFIPGPVLINFSYGHELPFNAFLYNENAEIKDNMFIIS